MGIKEFDGEAVEEGEDERSAPGEDGEGLAAVPLAREAGALDGGDVPDAGEFPGHLLGGSGMAVRPHEVFPDALRGFGAGDVARFRSVAGGYDDIAPLRAGDGAAGEVPIADAGPEGPVADGDAFGADGDFAAVDGEQEGAVEEEREERAAGEEFLGTDAAVEGGNEEHGRSEKGGDEEGDSGPAGGVAELSLHEGAGPS